MPFLQCYDSADAEAGGERNRLKTKVIYFTDADTLQMNAGEWRLDEMRGLSAVALASEGEPTLGVVTGPMADVIEQLQQKVRVVRAMQS